MQTPRSLNDLQLWFQAVITHPDGVRAGIGSVEAIRRIDVAPSEIDRVILPSKAMTSFDRLQIYGKAYFGRLIECLRAQFPAVRHAVGDAAFDGFAFGYLTQTPSVTYTLAALGKSFDSYLSATRPPRSEESDVSQPDFADFLIELVRLERIYGEVFDGAGPETLPSLIPDDFRGLSPEDFAESHLVLHECVRLLELRFPVHEFASAVRQGIEPSLPVPRSMCLVVTRRDYVVRRYEVNRQQFDLLSMIGNRSTIGEAIQSLCENSDFDIARVRSDLRTWFEEWSAAPLFAKMRRAGET